MGNVLKMAKKQQIQAFAVLGWSNRKISEATGIDRGTVSKYRNQNENPPIVPADVNAEKNENPPMVPTDESTVEGQDSPDVYTESNVLKLPSTKSRQLQPFASTVSTLYHRRLTAQRIYQDLVEQHGYRGSYDSVKRFVRKLRKRSKRYHERLSHLPGREAQVDFGRSSCLVKINDRYRKVWLFKMTLSCSKHAYEELVEHQDLETFIRCHERAFHFFGGVPEIVTIDNVKAGVLVPHIYDPILNRTYFAFATSWGFAANPCMPYKPEHKGIVERDVGYTMHNALDGRRFEGIGEGNVQLRAWNKRWARTRIHGTTKCQVWKLFCELERPALRPLAATPFEYFHVGKRKVDVSGLIEVESRYYGVPPRYVGESVVVHYNQQFIKVYFEEELVVTHRALQQKGKICMPAFCRPDWKHPDLESQERYYLQQAKKTGPNFHAIVYAVLSSDHPNAIRRTRGLLSLEKRFGSAVLEEAAISARTTAHYDYHSVKAKCEKLLDGLQLDVPLVQEHELIRSLDDYETAFTERTQS